MTDTERPWPAQCGDSDHQGPNSQPQVSFLLVRGQALLLGLAEAFGDFIYLFLFACGCFVIFFFVTEFAIQLQKN